MAQNRPQRRTLLPRMSPRPSSSSPTAVSKPLSLDRMLQQQGFGTRKLCQALVLAGEVSVDGVRCDDPQMQRVWQAQPFTVRGEPWTYRARCYLMMHKPKHHECSHKPHHHPSIYSLLPRPLVDRGVQCIGRLDEDTTGLILLSDDGQFIHQSSSPKHKVAKVYEVTCKHPLPAAALQRLTLGVQLVDEPAPVASLEASAVGERVIRLTLAEGKYHQVKRMIAAVGNRVEALRRIRIGQLNLPVDLTPGTWRWLTDSDRLACMSSSAHDSSAIKQEVSANGL
jgi:16S rRNA pseudouridine516 synthase